MRTTLVIALWVAYFAVVGNADQPRHRIAQPAQPKPSSSTAMPANNEFPTNNYSYQSQPSSGDAIQWVLVAVGIVTAAFIGWQAWETRRAAEATQKSAVTIEEQTTILKGSVEAAEKSADAARDSAMTARISADALINAERAWILAELGWYNMAGRVIEGTRREGSGQQIESTSVTLKLTCSNEGRSPAWIDHISARADIVSSISEIEDYDRKQCRNFGPLEPIAAGGQKSRSLDLECAGHRKDNEFLSI